MKRRVFQWFTVFLAIVSAWAVYANVLADDADVRKLARTTVNQAAGCGDACKLSGLRGDRGMLSETIEYDVQNHGHWEITCRRAMIVIGDYACTVTESGSGSAAPAGSK